jgi:hypothetical protein
MIAGTGFRSVSSVEVLVALALAMLVFYPILKRPR